MEKKPFVTLEQLKEIEKTYPTPFHIYDEKGIRENAIKSKGHLWFENGDYNRKYVDTKSYSTLTKDVKYFLL
jgi:hypothetical protein